MLLKMTKEGMFSVGHLVVQITILYGVLLIRVMETTAYIQNTMANICTPVSRKKTRTEGIIFDLQVSQFAAKFVSGQMLSITFKNKFYHILPNSIHEYKS